MKIKVKKMNLGNKKVVTVNNIVSHLFSLPDTDVYADHIAQ
ncbi:hypothetical protein PLEI_3606 [Photobacterium leiognathi lrivu.4.1]|uniref:Uncharacterized protein n=1 Tax=Photobacterium leiognathi lrivu.4.1 TaxID=1248232 RepID=V5F3J6_PHOLE|nr:hypothetical protein PLEI_3606 [Photobacterium leiognathi lrivu.4.1]